MIPHPFFFFPKTTLEDKGRKQEVKSEWERKAEKEGIRRKEGYSLLSKSVAFICANIII